MNWQAMLTAALIGSERSVVPPPPPGFPTKTAPADTTPADADPAAVLLDRAAAFTLARRAGRQPDRVCPPAAPDPDTRPMVSAPAGRRLARILDGDPAAGGGSDLLVEWLTAAVAARGLRPPPQFLPVLLERARRVSSANPDPEAARLRGLVAMAGGPRARWLAGLNPAWSYLLAEPVPALAPPVWLAAADAAKIVAAVDATADANSLTALMAGVPGPWPGALTARVLAKATRGLSQTPLNASRLIRLAGRRADPALGAPDALADFPPEAPNTLHTMLAVLRFRYEMLKELENADADS